MIARESGLVVLVAGAIPGEEVTARIERVGKGVAYAQAVEIERASPDRRDLAADPLCGGCAYAHISYPRQLDIKSQVVADALARIGRIVWPSAIAVRGSADEGYRMRARLHLRAGRVGFFREGTHEICDARQTGQLLPATCDVVDRAAGVLRSFALDRAAELEIAENIDATSRVMHLDAEGSTGPGVLEALGRVEGLTGVTDGRDTVGDATLVDRLEVGDAAVVLKRHVLAFFQGNRYLLADLVSHVMSVSAAARGTTVLDLYAGVGLFAVSAAARGAHVVAVEGDRMAARDLRANAAGAGGVVDVVHGAVEAFLQRARPSPDVAIVDPPRTGLSRDALEGTLRLSPRRIVYVSCDVATLARDARRAVDAGYEIEWIDAFDLFPRTPHVETVMVLDRASSRPA
jgi:23S rRNA (uracil1939-C5)-methyltransferase